jgi:hypothetical protein
MKTVVYNSAGASSAEFDSGIAPSLDFPARIIPSKDKSERRIIVPKSGKNCTRSTFPRTAGKITRAKPKSKRRRFK